MTAIQRYLRRLDLVFLSLVFFLFLINLPHFLEKVLVQHDSIFIFKGFYFVYNDFFFNAELPGWFPFGLYGAQSDTFLLSPSPSAWFSGLFGYLFGVRDVLFLFKISIFLEQFVLLVGTYLLSCRLFKYRATVFIVTLTVICSSALFVQLMLNFRSYALLPLSIYFLVRFFSEYKSYLLLSAMIVFMGSLGGLAAYFASINTLILLIISITLFLFNFKESRKIFEESRRGLYLSVALLSIFLLFVAVYFHIMLGFMNLLEGFVPGRDPVTMATDLKTFLTYGETMIGFEKFSRLIFSVGSFIQTDMTLFCGLITLLFALYALIYIRSASFIAFLVVTLVLAIFSLGDITPLAKALYYGFPTMKLFRHIGYVVTSLKIFLPFMAGFGVDLFLSRYLDGERDVDNNRVASAILRGLLTALLFAGSFIFARSTLPDHITLVMIVTALFILALFLSRMFLGEKRHITFFLVVAVIFHMLSYQLFLSVLYSDGAERLKPFTRGAVTTHQYDFQMEREKSLTTRHQLDVFPVEQGSTMKYIYDYNYIQFDPCVSIFRTDYLNSNVYSFFKLKGTTTYKMPYKTGGLGLRLPNDRNFLTSIGCFAPKLKLFTNVIFTGDLESASEIIKETREIDRLLVLSGVDEALRIDWAKRTETVDKAARGTIDIKGYSANRLTIDAYTPEEGGAWLFFADAFHPGWKAYVNGKLTPVAQANIAFKAVRVNKGKTKVEFVFVKDSRMRSINIFIFLQLIFVGLIIVLSFAILFKWRPSRGLKGES